MTLPPGPTAPAALQTLRWVYRPAQLMEQCAREYGDVFTLRVSSFQAADRAGGVVFVSDPTALKSIFTGGPKLSRVADARVAMRPMFGSSSVLMIDGDEHMRRRKLMLPAFHGERMKQYGELMEEITNAEIDSWPLGTRFSLQPAMARITLEVILRAVFGLDDGRAREEVRGPIEKLLADVANPFGELAMGLPERVYSALLIPFFRTRRAADRVLLAEIARRREDPGLDERTDVLSMLVQARYEGGEGMSDEDLRDQLVTLLLAGHETTATTMAWVMELLYRHPEAHRRLEQECADGGGDEYLDAVVQEAMRLYPPIQAIDRALAEPFEVGGYELPAGTVLAPCIYLAHRRPDVYPEPNAFRPERFLDDPPETYSWVPFGGGMRRCLGAAFATLEIRVVLRTLLRRATLRPASDKPERMHRRAIVIAPRHGARSVLHGRREAHDREPARELASAP